MEIGEVDTSPILSQSNPSTVSRSVGFARLYLETVRSFKQVKFLVVLVVILLVVVLIVVVPDYECGSSLPGWETRFWESYDRLQWDQVTPEPTGEPQRYRRIIAAAYCQNGEIDRTAEHGYRCV